MGKGSIKAVQALRIGKCHHTIPFQTKSDRGQDRQTKGQTQSIQRRVSNTYFQRIKKEP
jgi:hypothetical protein